MRGPDRYLVVGAGAAGLVTLKALREHGIDAEVLERRHDVGGMFAARPDPSVHLVRTAAATAFSGLAFAAGHHERPSFAAAHAYLGAYAARYDLRRAVRLGAGVARMEADPDGGWWVTTDHGEVRRYRGAVLAVGRTADARRLRPGEPGCPVLAAERFAGPEQVAGATVLVVGGGRTASDVATEVARSARRTLLSLPRGHPLLAGALSAHAPRALRRAVAAALATAALRSPGDHGLPRPDPGLFGLGRDGHRLRAAVARGEIAVRPPLARLAGGRAVFRCGRSEAVDLVVDASGPGFDVPFLDHWHLPWADGAPRLLLDVAHPARTDLFATGLLRSGVPTWPVLERQAELVARLVAAGPEAVAAFRRHAARGARGGALGETSRHGRALLRATRLLDRAGPPGPQAAAPIQAT